jgi:hypothetical protein
MTRRLVVLLPQIGFNLFDYQRELQECRIPSGESVIFRGEQRRSGQRRSGNACRADAVQKFTPPHKAAPPGIKIFLRRFGQIRV